MGAGFLHRCMHEYSLARRALVVFPWALGGNTLLAVSQALGSATGMQFELVHVAEFMLGTGLIAAVIVLLTALTRRVWLSCGTVGALTTLAAVANYEKLVARNEPLYPADIAFVRSPGFLVEMLDAKSLALGALLVAAPLAFCILLGRILPVRMRPATVRTPAGRTAAASRALVGLCCLAVFWLAAHFNSPGNPVRATYDTAGAHWFSWEQALNYSRNGFVGGFLYNSRPPAVPAPAGYSRATMDTLGQRYQRLAKRDNDSRSPSALAGVNIVMVLSESLSDPTQLAGVDVEGDPMPVTRRVMAHSPSGEMLSSQYGGGTANVEFEALTGMSMSNLPPQMTIPYQMLVPRYSTFPSAAGFLASRGYRTVAIHPSTASTYRRDAVFRAFGFDSFLDKTKMHHLSHLEGNPFPSDTAAFGEALRVIRHNDSKVFIHLITIQNHRPWRGYSRPMKVSGVDATTAQTAGQYARGVRYSDAALGRFLHELRSSHEKTIVLLYGDHLPGLWSAGVANRSGYLKMHETPFFIWKSFGTPDARRLPTTSPIYFMPLILRSLGAPTTPYYALLDRLRTKLPAMDMGRMLDARGTEVSAENLAPRTRRLLRDYRLVQYDLSVGNRFSEHALFRGDTRQRGLTHAGSLG